MPSVPFARRRIASPAYQIHLPPSTLRPNVCMERTRLGVAQVMLRTAFIPLFMMCTSSAHIPTVEFFHEPWFPYVLMLLLGTTNGYFSEPRPSPSTPIPSPSHPCAFVRRCGCLRTCSAGPPRSVQETRARFLWLQDNVCAVDVCVRVCVCVSARDARTGYLHKCECMLYLEMCVCAAVPTPGNEPDAEAKLNNRNLPCIVRQAPSC